MSKEFQRIKEREDVKNQYKEELVQILPHYTLLMNGYLMNWFQILHV